jgi:SAM-dependent methyltransferase
MFRLRLHVRHCAENEIAGWIDEGKDPEPFHVELNGQAVGQLCADLFRRDLAELGMGDGRRGFVMRLPATLRSGDKITLKRGGQAFVYFIIGGPLNGGFAIDYGVIPPPSEAHDFAQTRWRGDEADEHLTFGAMMTGDSLWDIYCRHRTFQADRILEIGPGYGRLLKTAMERRIPFASYVGLELSPARVAKLKKDFPDSRVRFVQGDVDEWRDTRPFDIILSSAVFEHLHPDCRRALINLSGQMRPGAHAFIDFIATDTPGARWTSTNWLRWYPPALLIDLFANAGLDVRAIERCVIGIGNAGPIERFVVTAIA